MKKKVKVISLVDREKERRRKLQEEFRALSDHLVGPKKEG